MSKEHEIEAVMLDYNGVVADTDAHDIKAVNFACDNLGIPTPDDYQRYFGGRTLREGFATYVKSLSNADESISDEKITELMRLKLSLDSQYPENIIPYRNTLAFIENLSGFKVALVTGARKALIDMALPKLGLVGYFDAVITAEDYEEGKPSPEAYLKAIALLGVNPAQTVGIEDHPLGIRALKSAGAYSIAVTQTHSASDLFEADLVTENLLDLRIARWLNERRSMSRPSKS